MDVVLAAYKRSPSNALVALAQSNALALGQTHLRNARIVHQPRIGGKRDCLVLHRGVDVEQSQ